MTDDQRLTIRISDEMLADLNKASHLTDRSKPYIVRDLIQQKLKEWLKDYADKQSQIHKPDPGKRASTTRKAGTRRRN